MRTQQEKGAAFRALHLRNEAFIIPNPWDPGTAHLLEMLGFEALASTSAGYAFSQAVRDNRVGRERMLAHLRLLASATDLPISADLENGYGDSPDSTAETIRLAAEAGVVGGSIEDSINRPGETIYPFEQAVDRVRAAVEAARSLPFDFTLTARAENYLLGRPDLSDTIRRLQAYQEAGADVLFAPGLTNRDDIATLVKEVDRPVNVVMGLQGVQLDLADLSAMGVKRVSVGSALSRTVMAAFLRAAREMREHGSFSFANEAIAFRELNAMF